MPEEHPWGLIEPFDIDHGELDGLTPVAIFVLGVEWAMFSHQIQTYRSDITLIHRANAERLMRLLQRHRLHWVVRDLDDTWAEVEWSHDFFPTKGAT